MIHRPLYETRLQSLGFTLPDPPKAVATYVPAVKIGDMVFTSGMLPFVDGKIKKCGAMGAALSVEEGQEAARLALLNALAVLKATLGSLDPIQRIVQMTLYVAAVAEFTQHPAVANGASDLAVAIFGDAGQHARLAVGVASLPLGAPVELALIAQIARV